MHPTKDMQTRNQAISAVRSSACSWLHAASDVSILHSSSSSLSVSLISESKIVSLTTVSPNLIASIVPVSSVNCEKGRFFRSATTTARRYQFREGFGFAREEGVRAGPIWAQGCAT